MAKKEEKKREKLIKKVIKVYFRDDDPKYDASNRKYLESLSTSDLELKAMGF